MHTFAQIVINMQPYLINFKKIGKSSEGYLSISESLKDVPFNIKRTFWTYYTPEEVIRGRHTHYNTEMVLIAVTGTIIVNTETLNGDKNTFVLDKPHTGLFLPKFSWHTMQFSHSSVLLVLASTPYHENDYIREIDDFETIKNIQIEQNTNNSFSFFKNNNKIAESEFVRNNENQYLQIEFNQNITNFDLRIVFNLIIAKAVDYKFTQLTLDKSKYLYLRDKIDYVWEIHSDNLVILNLSNRF
jgi:hypothetical protein